MKLYKPGDNILPFKEPKMNGSSASIRIGTKHLGKPGIYKDPNTGYVGSSRKRFVVQNPDLPKNKVSVSLFPGEKGKILINIEVWATHGTGNQSVIGTVDPGQCQNAGEVRQKVQATAGAAAEHLCEAFGDVLDPDLCAKYALELLREVILKAEELKAKRQK
jgi:hypothetical protein